MLCERISVVVVVPFLFFVWAKYDMEEVDEYKFILSL